MKIDVTEDHSLYNEGQEEIKPSEINDDTKLEYKDINPSDWCRLNMPLPQLMTSAKVLARGYLEAIPDTVLNVSKGETKVFLDTFKAIYNGQELSKACQAGLLFMKKKIKN